MSSIQKITNLKGISYRVFIRRKGINEYIIDEKAKQEKWLRKMKEEDEKIRKEYGIKDDEDWFDGRYGIKIYKCY